MLAAKAWGNRPSCWRGRQGPRPELSGSGQGSPSETKRRARAPSDVEEANGGTASAGSSFAKRVRARASAFARVRRFGDRGSLRCSRSRKGLERMLRHRGERSCGRIGRGSLRSWRAAKGSEGAGFALRFEGPAAGSVEVRFDRREPRRGLRMRGSLRGSKVPRCAVSGFASMPGSRRRSLRRVRSPRGRQAVRIGRFASGSDRPRGTKEISVFCGTRGRWRGEGFALVRHRPLRSEAVRASGSLELRKRDLGIQASALPASRREPPRPSRPGRDPRGPEKRRPRRPGAHPPSG